MSEHQLNPVTAEILSALDSAGKDFSAHSIFAPSSSAMWTGCSGSLIPNLFKSDRAGRDAAEGSVAHEVGEIWLKTGEKPIHLLGTTKVVAEGDTEFEIEIDEVMFDFVEQYVNWCADLPGNHFVETRVDFSDLTPIRRQTGTADHGACSPGELVITDLKYGKGHRVFAKENTQALIYAYGFFRKHDDLFNFQEITIRICQPRLENFDVWVISRQELLDWAAWIKAKAYAAWCKNAVRTPGEKQCTWCKIKLDCAAFVVFTERIVDGVFENLDQPITSNEIVSAGQRIDSGDLSFNPITLGALTVPQKAKLLPYRKMVENWFADLAADLEQRCVNGEKIPGYKLVNGKSNRVFADIDEAVELLDFLGLPDEVIRPRGMISPAQAEDALVKIGYRRKQMETLIAKAIRKPPGKPTMVPESDKREGIDSAASNPFDNLDETL